MKTSMKTKSISHLLEDHRTVRKILSSFDRFVLAAENRSKLPVPANEVFDSHELWPLLDYLSEHLLMCHEEKEEVALLPELSRHGLSWEDTDLQHVRQEHRHIVYLMRCVRQSVQRARSWTPEDFRHFLAVSRELTSFLEHHMEAEETHLFIKLDVSFCAADDARLLVELEEIERDYAAMPDAAQLRSNAENFLKRYQQH